MGRKNEDWLLEHDGSGAAADECKSKVVELDHFRLDEDFRGIGNDGIDNAKFFAHGMFLSVVGYQI